MAQISAITSQSSKSAAAVAASSNSKTSDEFSEIFESLVPGYALEDDSSLDIDTSVTVAATATAPVIAAPLTVQAASVSPQTDNVGDNPVPQEDEQVVANGDSSEDQRKTDKQSSDDGGAVDIQGVAADENRPSTQGVDQTSDTTEEVVTSDPQEALATAGADLISQEIDDSGPEPLNLQAKEIIPEQVQQANNEDGAQVDDQLGAKIRDGEVVQKTVKDGANSRANHEEIRRSDPVTSTSEIQATVDASSSAPIEKHPKIENPVFGALTSSDQTAQGEKVVKAQEESSRGPGISYGNNSPLMEVLLNQVQRLVGQTTALPTLDRPELSFAAKAGAQIGAAGGATLPGLALGRTDQDTRAAKIARPVPVVSTKTLERVQKVLADAVAAQDGKTISLRLDPPELGKVKVDVSLRGGQLSARIVAESSSVTAFLRERAHELHQTLRKLGIEANSVTVSVGAEFGQSNGENRANAENERQSGSRYEGNFLEQEILEGVVDSEEFDDGKISIDHRIA